MKKISKGMLMAALICGSFSVLNVASAEEMQTFEMDEFVVTAARTETRLVDTPANISVVGAQQIEEKKYQDMGEVLKDVDGVTVLDTGVGTKEKMIKLNGDDRVLILVDGRRVGTDMGSNAGGQGGAAGGGELIGGDGIVDRDTRQQVGRQGDQSAAAADGIHKACQEQQGADNQKHLGCEGHEIYLRGFLFMVAQSVEK